MHKLQAMQGIENMTLLRSSNKTLEKYFLDVNSGNYDLVYVG